MASESPTTSPSGVRIAGTSRAGANSAESRRKSSDQSTKDRQRTGRPNLSKRSQPRSDQLE